MTEDPDLNTSRKMIPLMHEARKSMMGLDLPSLKMMFEEFNMDKSQIGELRK